MSLFAGEDCLSRQALVDFRVKRLAYSCIDAVYKNRLVVLKDVLVNRIDELFYYLQRENYIFHPISLV